MKAKIEDLKLWRKMRQRGDILAIAKMAGVSRYTINRALKSNSMSVVVYMALRVFYETRRNIIANVIDSDND